MIALTRAGWLASAALFATLVASILRVHFAGPLPFALLAAVAVVCAVRPAWGLPAVTALLPVAWFGASRFWNAQAAWAEALACAALAGLAFDACRPRPSVPRPIAAPAAVLAAIVAASLAASLSVLGLRGGPPFWRGFAHTMTHGYYVDHSLIAVHAGLLLLEGTLLFAHAARLGTQPALLRRVCAATALGSAAAAACTFERLAEAASRAPSFWPALVDLAGRLRWNVHYDDVNAAGSYFALALLAGAGLAATSAGWRRAIWTVCTLMAATALWLTSSRIALLAAPAAVAAALILPLAIRSRRQAVQATLAVAGVCLALAVLSIFLPQRGIQKSSLLAADIRLGLIETGLEMMRAHPTYGIGLGEFQQRSGEFSSPELIAKFPAAVHENAHNNVVQIAAETGVAGGLAFVWTIGVAVLAVGWRATATRDRLLQFVFAALAAFVLTALAGHPLLIPEAAFGFWILAGAAGGAAFGDRVAEPRSRRRTVLVAAALLLVAITLPLRIRAAARGADLDHIGIGVSPWHVSPDGIRYREAVGHATLFVPSSAYKFSVNPRTRDAIRLEVSVDGRTANVLMLTPGGWTDIVVRARTTQGDARFRRMDLRTIDNEDAAIWVTKDEPVVPR
jgi:O-antigen ligase